MDLTLSLSYQEQNDNKAIILTDTSNYDITVLPNLVEGNETVEDVLYEIVSQLNVQFPSYGALDNNAETRFIWNGAGQTLGAGDELKQVTPNAAEITTLILDTTITGTDSVATIKDQVDLYVLNGGPFTGVSELVFTITAELLGDAADSLLVDGLYKLEYTITYDGEHQAVANPNPQTQILEVTILVYGQVKVATYEKLRNISTLYMCNDGCPSPEISEADLCGAYLSSIENSAYIAKTEELLSMLVVLDNIIKNGSNITW